jgi:hypothetical protein
MAIGSKFSGFTALSSTTAVLLGGAAVELPAKARSIVAMIPILTSPAGNTAAQPIAAEAYLESDDVKLVPYHVFPQPIGSSLLLSIGQAQGAIKDTLYPVNCPVKGGEQIKCYGKGLFDHTIEPYMGVLIIYSDQPPDKPQVFAKIGTFTNTGTAAARVTGSGITVVGGRRLIEIMGFAVGTTVAALKGIAGHIDLACEGFTPAWALHLPINPISGQVDTDIQENCAGVSRLQVDIAMADKCVINDGFTLAVALTTTGNWIVGVLYN